MGVGFRASRGEVKKKFSACANAQKQMQVCHRHKQKRL
ncbi:hypothetical protein AB28_5321 [Raoultella ornithinolytica 2-156-04_S1_C2]|nr:hypothetical protein AB00_5330 [Raoultella ornithinolytica 2-156-04_S1_C1]KDX08840.1 hypothetical protein AB28_5321 [Raoultella ornithinolytica 2-156-04_S1_C2]